MSNSSFASLRESRRLLPLLAAAIMCALGLWMRAPLLTYPGPQESRAFNSYAFRHFSYSDIASLYYRDALHTHPRPYFDYRLEYPVGTGLLIYILNTARSPGGYFLLTSLVLSLCGLATVWLIPRFPRGRPWLLALSPSLALYMNLNWDLFAILLTTLALVLFVRERDGPAAVCLAAAVWTKFFPIVLLPLVLAERVRADQLRAAAGIALSFTLASAAINLPLLILRPAAWWHFFESNRTRPREVNLWNFFDHWNLTTTQINTWSALLLAAGLAVLILSLWRRPEHGLLFASCAALAWFFFVNKVYSPQYSLWIVVLLAAVGPPIALATAWSMADVIYFAASFLILGLVEFGHGEVTTWFFDRALLPAMALREGLLLVIIGWCISRMLQRRRASVGSSPAT